MVASLLVIRGFSGRQLEEVGRGSADATDQPSPARGTAPAIGDLENAGPSARTALLKIGGRPADLKRS
jgi:hypothetical protein